MSYISAWLWRMNSHMCSTIPSENCQRLGTNSPSALYQHVSHNWFPPWVIMLTTHSTANKQIIAFQHIFKALKNCTELTSFLFFHYMYLHMTHGLKQKNLWNVWVIFLHQIPWWGQIPAYCPWTVPHDMDLHLVWPSLVTLSSFHLTLYKTSNTNSVILSKIYLQ